MKVLPVEPAKEWAEGKRPVGQCGNEIVEELLLTYHMLSATRKYWVE